MGTVPCDEGLELDSDAEALLAFDVPCEDDWAPEVITEDALLMGTVPWEDDRAFVLEIGAVPCEEPLVAIVPYEKVFTLGRGDEAVA